MELHRRGTHFCPIGSQTRYEVGCAFLVVGEEGVIKIIRLLAAGRVIAPGRIEGVDFSDGLLDKLAVVQVWNRLATAAVTCTGWKYNKRKAEDCHDYPAPFLKNLNTSNPPNLI